MLYLSEPIILFFFMGLFIGLNNTNLLSNDTISLWPA